MPGYESLPSGALGEWVEGLWMWEGSMATAPCETALPSGSVDLVINLETDQLRFGAADARARRVLPGAVLCGPHHRYFLIDTSLTARALGVRFKSGRIRSFLPGAAVELQDGWVAANDVWGSAVTSLRERLLEASTPAEHFQHVDAFLLQRARSASPPGRLVEALQAFDDPDLTSVAAVRERVDLSPKQLLSVSSEHVGLGPKAYWRVRRFRAALRLIERRSIGGATIAAQTGYFDQAHLDREFRHFTGCSPSTYLAHHVGRPNHGPVHG
jgi:AraC-like DNA-binding protein